MPEQIRDGAIIGGTGTVKRSAGMKAVSQPSAESPGDHFNIRAAVEADLDAVAMLDERVTGIGKPDYWRDVYERYSTRRTQQRFFLVAEATGDGPDRPLLGYIVGEVRAWEFGSEPCGWVFAFSVDPDSRLQGLGEHLFNAISEKFKAAGIKTMRTMVARDNQLHMAFFRSEGMTAGPYIQLEKELD
jgi:ribosomal protein S18 acetylase RimI-like enzyme